MRSEDEIRRQIEDLDYARHKNNDVSREYYAGYRNALVWALGLE